ncbi:MAG: PAS domain S-box protein [Planctomycetales bacterium]|nr:PAS domain S-box protein [Planctomycetales bacterium]
MPLRSVRNLPRSFQQGLGVIFLLASYLPLWSAGVERPNTMFLPLVTTAVVLTSQAARSHHLVLLTAVLSLLTILPSGAFQSTDTTVNVLTFWFCQAVIVGTHYVMLLSPRAPVNVQSRLAGRLRRQSEQLQHALESQENAERSGQLRSVHDRRTLLEHLPVHVVQKDCDGRFTFVSQSFCDLVGREYAEVIGKTDFDLFPEETAAKFVRDDKTVVSTGGVFNDVEETQLPDGTRTYMQVRKAALHDPAGQVVGVQGVFWDVTEEQTRLRQLQRIESMAHALITAALDAVLIVDGDGRVLDANPASAKILGYQLDEVASHPPIGEFMHTSVVESGQRKTDKLTQDQSYVRNTPVTTILKSATGRRIEARLRHREGSWFDAEISAHPLTIEDSQGWAIFIRNITKRKQAEQELRSAKEAAEQANATIGDFVANVSHELRTPLTGIIGLHELLARSSLGERQRNYLRLAKISAGNLLTLIDDLLDFSKIESGQIELEVAPFDLIACVEEATISLSARAQIKGLEILLDLPKIAHAGFLGDPHRIKQILLNLIGNAIKFTERGEIRIAVTLNETTDQDGLHRVRARFEIHDSGIGVSPDQRQVIFDAFRQADSSTTRRYGGTGLGLTICRDLVNQLGGVIGIGNALALDGSIRQGSCFFFELPLQVVESSAAAQVESPTIGLPTPESSAEGRAAKRRRETVVLSAPPGAWKVLLEREIMRLGFEVIAMTPDELANKYDSPLFLAGNHTLVMAEFRDLVNLKPEHAPVVLKWILLHPLASDPPQTLPVWLKHADLCWLPRPVLRQQLAAALETIERSEEVSPPEAAETPTRPAQVLLVEDSNINQTILEDMVSGLGHHVTAVSNGREAVEACQSFVYDLVLMDIQMPDIDGLEATKVIRATERSSGQRQTICALTAHATAKDRMRCTEAGMDFFLVKPVSLADLKEAINLALGDSKVASELILQSNLTATSDAGEGEIQGSVIVPPQTELILSEMPNWQQLVTLMHDNEPLLKDVLKLVSRELPRLAREFDTQVVQGNATRAHRAVHTFKSNVRQIGLERVANYAAQLETHARDQRLADLEPHRQHLLNLANTIADWADETVLNEGSTSP